jgi:hypothetical protein
MRLATTCILLALAGCSDRRSFDDRYEETEQQLEARIRNLDSNLSSELPDTNGAAANGPSNAAGQ